MEICPQALFLNYTNPMTVLTRVLSRQGVRVMGLCHEWAGVQKKLAPLLGVTPDQVTARIAGINHLIWAMELRAGGRDAWLSLSDLMDRVISGEVVVDEEDTTVFADPFLVKAHLFKAFGALPVAGDRHLAEFFPHFITEGTNWGQDYKFRLTSIEDRMGMAFFARTLLESILKGDTPLGPALEQLSSEDAAEIIAAAITGEPYLGLMNLPNVGQIANLPQEAVVETMGMVDQSGAHPITFGALPLGIQAVLERHVRSQEMTVEAALTGDPELALQVLLNDPLSGRLTLSQTTKMLDELIEANIGYLPGFINNRL
jgi:alpha-galactosidase